MCGLSAGTKLSGRCGEVAVSGGSTVVERRFYEKKGGGSDFVTYLVVVMSKTILASFVFL